jgi:hypothetical protein
MGPATKPWYREPWPWALIAGPAAVAMAGGVTIWLAVSSNDGLVADDYYRRGLAINQVLVRDREAARLGFRARLHVTDSGALEVALTGTAERPPALTLKLVHPTRAGEDRLLRLIRVAPGLYRVQSGPLPSGRRNAVLEDEAGTWRLTGEWAAPSGEALELLPNSGRSKDGRGG